MSPPAFRDLHISSQNPHISFPDPHISSQDMHISGLQLSLSCSGELDNHSKKPKLMRVLLLPRPASCRRSSPAPKPHKPFKIPYIKCYEFCKAGAAGVAMVSLARRSSSGAWIQERGGLKWRTGIFFDDVEGNDGTITSSCLPHLLSSPSALPILILSMLPLQIPKGSQLLGQTRDAAFPGGRISGGWGWAVGITEAVDSLVRWVKPGHLLRSLRGVEEGWEKAFGRREEGSRGRGLGGSMEGLCPPHSCGSCFETHKQKSGAEPLRASLPGLSQLLPQLRLCPSCWKWNKT